MSLEIIHLIRDRVKFFEKMDKELTKRERNRIFKSAGSELNRDAQKHRKMFQINLISEKRIKLFFEKIQDRESETIEWDGCGGGQSIVRGISITWQEYHDLSFICFLDEKVVKKYNKKLAKNSYYIYSWLDCDCYRGVELRVCSIEKAQNDLREYTEELIKYGSIYPWHS